MRKKKGHVWLVCCLVLLCTVLTACFTAYQFRNYENGKKEVYANQQDAMVQLVLDQVRLQGGSEEAVTRILATLDASTGRYWTLSADETMLFVKDVVETNKYKGFTARTYYITDSAHAFFQSLPQNGVLHRIILIDDKEMIASGAAFSFGGKVYRICMLTNTDTLLEQNAYLNAKINLLAMLAVLLCMFAVFLILLAIDDSRQRRRHARAEQECQALRRRIDETNTRYLERDLYLPRKHVFHMDALPLLAEKLVQRQAKHCAVLYLEADSPEAADSFLSACTVWLGDDVFRFASDATHLALVFTRCDPQPARDILRPYLSGLRITGQGELAALACQEEGEKSGG